MRASSLVDCSLIIFGGLTMTHKIPLKPGESPSEWVQREKEQDEQDCLDFMREHKLVDERATFESAQEKFFDDFDGDCDNCPLCDDCPVVERWSVDDDDLSQEYH